MYFVKISHILLFIFFISCNNITDDLYPDGSDKRNENTSAESETLVGKQAPEDVTIFDIQGSSFSPLNSGAQNPSVKVLYFTMWCSICNAHSDFIINKIYPDYPDAKYYLVDYVSGTIENSILAVQNSGYSKSIFSVLISDNNFSDTYNGSMGITVVIDKNGFVRMHEYFKDGTRLIRTIQSYY